MVLNDLHDELWQQRMTDSLIYPSFQALGRVDDASFFPVFPKR